MARKHFLRFSVTVRTHCTCGQEYWRIHRQVGYCFCGKPIPANQFKWTCKCGKLTLIGRVDYTIREKHFAHPTDPRYQGEITP